jgi:hypothetical protein
MALSEEKNPLLLDSFESDRRFTRPGIRFLWAIVEWKQRFCRSPECDADQT